MCGIVGILSFQESKPIQKDLLIKMRDTLKHRGPDGNGSWLSKDRRIGLAHTRLSVIDLSDEAFQPLSNEDGSIWVVFNGEIYNHASIRKELEIIGGHTWKTDHSDTEVIIHAYEEWGFDCVNKFNGMFAFGLWDGHRRELWLVRDRIGIKPLYYSFYKGKLSFASEIKALLVDPDRSRAVNDQALFHYLSFLTTPAPQTMFEGIKKVPGGNWIKIDLNGNFQEYCYWNVLENTIDLNNLSETEISNILLSQLRKSVELRKIGDVPIGVFLSGGIDSSTNATLFSENNSSKVNTFSLGYDQDYITYKNELHHARRVSKRIGTTHKEKILSQNDLLNFIPEMIWLQDEPIADPVCVPLFYLSKLARENGMTVCQAGEGADELFCGYPYWNRLLKLQTANDFPFPKIIKEFGLKSLEITGNSESKPYEWLKRGILGQKIFWGGAEGFTHEQKIKILSPRLQKMFRGYSSWEVIKPIYKEFINLSVQKDNLNWMSYLDLNLRLPELLLMRIDKMSMGVSLECRVPFLDHKLVELAFSMPQNIKVKNGKLKYILKKAVKEIIPEDIINRKKQGFDVPIDDWFPKELGDYSKNILQKFVKDTDYFNKNELLDFVERKKGLHSWYLINFALWHEQYIR